MDPPALPAARITRRPVAGGAGKCAGRQLAGCAAATAVRNRRSSKVRGGAVKSRARMGWVDRGAWIRPHVGENATTTGSNRLRTRFVIIFRALVQWSAGML